MKQIIYSLILSSFLVSCSSKEEEQLFKSIDEKIILEGSECLELVKEFEKRSKTKAAIYSYPFATIYNRDENTQYTFYRKEKVIFVGDHTLAWSYRMNDKKAECYPLELADVKELIRLNSEKTEEPAKDIPATEIPEPNPVKGTTTTQP